MVHLTLLILLFNFIVPLAASMDKKRPAETGIEQPTHKKSKEAEPVATTPLAADSAGTAAAASSISSAPQSSAAQATAAALRAAAQPIVPSTSAAASAITPCNEAATNQNTPIASKLELAIAAAANKLPASKPTSKRKPLVALLEILPIREMQDIVLSYLVGWEKFIEKNWKSLGLKTENCLISAFAFSPDGNRLAISLKVSILVGEVYIDEYSLCIIELKNQTIQVLPISTSLSFDDRPMSLAFSPDGSKIAAGSQNGVIIYDAKTFSPKHKINKQEVYVRSVAFSPDKKYLVTGLGNGIIRIWDGQTFELMQTWRNHTNDISFLEFSKDSKLLISNSHDRTINIWNMEKMDIKPLQLANNAYSGSISPCGNFIAICSHTHSPDKIMILDRLQGYREHRKISSDTSRVQFSLCGKYLIAYQDQRSTNFATLFDTQNEFKEIQTIPLQGCFYRVAFSPCGNYIAAPNSSSLDLWRNQVSEIENYNEENQDSKDNNK